LYVSTITLREATVGEYLAAAWQGSVPDGLVLHRWLGVGTDNAEMLLIWEATPEAAAWVTELFTTFGTITTRPARDATPGLATCWARDLTGFGEFLRTAGVAETEIDSALDVRQRGMSAGSRDEAVEAGRAWARHKTAGGRRS
jgi:hypothetical protein